MTIGYSRVVTVIKGPHHLLLSWTIFTGIIIFSLFVAWQEEVIFALYASDKSKISFAITLLYLVMTVHCARRIYLISTQINDSRLVEDLIRESTELELNINDDKVHINGNTALPDCIVTNYIHDLLHKGKNKNGIDSGIANNELIEVYESKLKGPHDIGWFMADLMIKMGLLGTIIGFILMLASVANITDFDVTTMQKVLKQMSIGMGTALYTTLAGLTCSMLMAAQYHMLDRGADELIETTKHLTQVYILPRII
jgi:hypothetical protein